jgi:hypothetical protein
MERKSQQEDQEAPLWRRHSDAVGKLRLYTPGMDPRRAIKPGQKIRATVAQLGTAIKQFDLLEGDVDKDLVAKLSSGRVVPLPKENYTMVAKGGGWYDVVSADGKKMNDKGLKADAANDLIDKLEAE